MRVSVEPADPGYSHMAHRCRVWLAGAERGNVVTADEEKRWAKVLRLNESGKPVVKDGQPQTEEFWGDVRIEPPPGFTHGVAAWECC